MFSPRNYNSFSLKKINGWVILLCFSFLLVACKRNDNVNTEPEKPVDTKPVVVPPFQRDSAYAHISKQVSFGPRVPGTQGHKATKEWLVQKFKSYGASVREQ